ncbi:MULTISPECIES: hypothetical protein [unclassified Rhizobium]|uniref:hypothetical protein n=1 Tax=unclassified Rhizobium TaxID=2613769 RepID=UPI0015CF3B99|nr:MULTISPECIES: hypothetical protein [unclassified Rhizobium]MDF0659719.1 hypothetical protein [Rhizobium sp. BC49]
MPYVMRNADGDICGLFEQPQNGRADEFLPDDAAEVVAFVNQRVPAAYTIGKSTPWRRMSDEEVADVDAAMQSATLKQRRIYEAASYISTEDELFGTLKALLSAVLSPSRADELLAPET